MTPLTRHQVLVQVPRAQPIAWVMPFLLFRPKLYIILIPLSPRCWKLLHIFQPLSGVQLPIALPPRQSPAGRGMSVASRPATPLQETLPANGGDYR